MLSDRLSDIRQLDSTESEPMSSGVASWAFLLNRGKKYPNSERSTLFHAVLTATGVLGARRDDPRPRRSKCFVSSAISSQSWKPSIHCGDRSSRHAIQQSS